MKKIFSRGFFTAAAAKAFVILTAVCLCFAALPLLASNILPEALAETETYEVPANASVATINAALANYPSGTVVNMKLSGDVDLTVAGETLTDPVTGIVIPEGLTVNLYMNGKNILFLRETGGVWQLPGVYAIENKGVLAIYSGSGPDSPRASTASETKSCIKLINNRTDMKANIQGENAYSLLTCVKNSGELTVDKNVTFKISDSLTYNDNKSSCEATATVSAVGVYNVSTSAKATLNGAKVDLYSNSCGWTSAARRGHSHSYVYGVYGGDVSIKGETTINVRVDGYAKTSSMAQGDMTARINVIAYGVVTRGKVEMTGGTIGFNASVGQKKSGGFYPCEHDEGAMRVFIGGILTNSGNNPTLVDGNINPPAGGSLGGNNYDHAAIQLVRDSTVATIANIPLSPEEYLEAIKNDWRTDNDYPHDEISAGNFKDECGNSYSTDMKIAWDSFPTAISRGALVGENYRVHIIYRYWLDTSKNRPDTSVVGTAGNTAFSYLPLGDGTHIVKTVVKLQGVLSDTSLLKNRISSVSYKSGGEVLNPYYYYLFNLAYATTDKFFSDYNVLAGGNLGTVFKNFSTTSSVDNPVGENQQSPIYIFVDYVKVPTTNIKAKTSTVSTAYTGYNIKASDIGLKVLAQLDDEDFTDDYNIDFAPSSPKIPIRFTYTGTTAAGTHVESGTDNIQLPRDAGAYMVTLHIDSTTTYNPDSVRNKNRSALEYTFSLTINQAEALRGSLPGTIDLTYGEKLNQALTLTAFTAEGIASDGPLTGVFSFVDPSDGSSFKNAGTGNVQIKWTPTYPNTATTKNYKETEFTVSYTVNKANLEIRPNAAKVEYGDTEFTTPYSVNLLGLVGNDDNDNVKREITEALGFTIEIGGSYHPYSAGEASVGTYPIRAVFAASPAVINNYEYSVIYGPENNPQGILTVTKRGLKVKATAATRDYDVANFRATVSFEIIGGRFGGDDISIGSTDNGIVNDNRAGDREVTGIGSAVIEGLFAGGKKDNYFVEELVYATGEKLLVHINQGIPNVTPPAVDDMFYRRDRTLSAIVLGGGDTSVPGTWSWVNPATNPTVAVNLYPAEFTPTDNINYAKKQADISINVLPSDVTVTYEREVQYGDNIPNITEFEYTSAQDPSFNINYVTTTGNISPSTSYVKGSPVVDGGYPVTITAPYYADVAGNYIFHIVNGKIIVLPKNFAFTVGNKTIVYGEDFAPAGNNVDVTYDESALVGEDTINSVVSGGADPTFNFGTNFSYLTNYAVGEYDITAVPTFTSSVNYNVTTRKGALTVEKARLTIKGDNYTLEYNSEVPDAIGSNSAFSLMGVKRSESLADIVSCGTITTSTAYTKGSSVRPEGYVITVNTMGVVTPNYTLSVEHGMITVIKATPVITTYPEAELIYTQTLADAVFTGAVITDDVAGSFKYNSPTTSPVYSPNPYTNYSATFIPDDTANYNSLTGFNIVLHVRKKPIEGSLGISGIPMVGETLTADLSGLDPSGASIYTFEWKDGDTSLGTGKTLSLTSAHKGKTITLTVTATGYYEGDRSVTSTAIAPTLTSVETILTPEEWANYFTLSGLANYKAENTVVYNARAQAVSFGQKDTTLSECSIGAITVKYNGSETAPTNVGTYRITIDIGIPSGDFDNIIEQDGKTFDNTNGKYIYSPISGYEIGTLKITKAPYTVHITIADKVYDGNKGASAANITESGACTLVGDITDDVSFNRNSISYLFSDANVGERTVTWTGASLRGGSAANYALTVILENDAKAFITKRALRVSVIPIPRVYEADRYDIDLTFETDASSLASTDNIGQVYVDGTKVTGKVTDYRAGLRNVAITVTEPALIGSKAANYELELTNLSGLTVEIEKAAPSYPLPNTSTLYYDSGRKLRDISLGDSHWQWDESVSDVCPNAGTYTYKAIYTPDDSLNFTTVEYNVPIEIRKAPVTVTANTHIIVYGSQEPTYRYTVTGLTGADTIASAVHGYVLISCSYEAGKDVGHYPVVLDGRFVSDNYNFTYVNGIVTVEQRVVTTEPIAISREYVAGDKKVWVEFSSLQNVYEADIGSVYLGTDPGVAYRVRGDIESDIPGEYPVTFVMPELGGDKKDNYKLEFSSESVRVIIKKARLTGVTLPTTAKVTYGRPLSEAEFTSAYAGGELGTFQLQNPNTTPDSVGTFANEYKVVFTPHDTLLFASIEDFITLTVEPAHLNVSAYFTGTAQCGKMLYVVINDLPAGAADYLYFDWYRVNSHDSPPSSGVKVASGTDRYKLTDADKGKYIVCVIRNIADSPYICSTKAVTDIAVTEQHLSFWQRLLRWFYRLLSNFTQIFGKMRGR